MNKKGNVYDAFIILGMMFFIGIVSILMLLLVGTVKDALVADDSVPQVAKDIVVNGEGQLPGIYDWFFALFFIGLPIVSAIFAYFNNIHPLFFWASMLVVIVVVLVGAGYQVFWEELATDSELYAQMIRLPITNLVMTNYGMYSLLVFVIIAAGTFIKLRDRPMMEGYP